jgi:hypothetical protein
MVTAMLRRRSAEARQARELARLLAALDALGSEQRAALLPRPRLRARAARPAVRPG